MSEPRIMLIAQMGYDVPRPFVPGFWVPAPVSGYGTGPSGRGFNRRALFFSGFPPARERRGLVANGSPSPQDPLLISPWEGEGDGSRERGLIGVIIHATWDRGVGDI